MRKLRNNQTGFGAVETLIVIVIITLIGVAGWFVYQNQHTTTNDKSNTNSSSKTTEKASVTKADGQVIATVDKKVQVTIPNSWHVVKDSNNQTAQQIISINKGTHLCDKYNPTDCSAIAPCLSSDDTVACTYEAGFQPKTLDPEKDNIWNLTVEKSNMTVSQASQQLLGGLDESNTVEKNSAKINGYDALYAKVKGGDCSGECYVDVQYFISYNGYLVHLNNREQYTNHSVNPANQNYSAYTSDFAKIVNSLKLSL